VGGAGLRKESVARYALGMDYRALMSGQRRGLAATLLRAGLWFGSLFYGLAVRVRNRRYDAGKLPIERMEVPVISIGNLTTGGTGKTPLVCLLAKRLRERGVRVSLVSRGYGRGEASSNDEALELEQRLPDVPHVQDPDRVAAATVAVEELETQLVLMDDGFQHRRLHRDLDILVIDATCPFGYGALLPRGMLREPLSSLARADIAVLSRSNYVSQAERTRIRDEALQYHPQLLWLEAEHRPSVLVNHRQQEMPLSSLQGQNVLAFCGIGNPAAFARTVRDCGAKLVDLKALPDHAKYDAPTMRELQRWSEELASQHSVDRIVCTQKDLVKIRVAQIGRLPVQAIQVDLQIGDEQPLWQRIERLLSNETP